MKKLILLLLALSAAYVGYQQQPSSDTEGGASISPSSITATSNSDDALIAAAFRDQRSNVLVTAHGTVSKILNDDNDDSRHQRFIVQLASEQTLFVAHNIDLADRVENLRTGDAISLRGEYEWNNKGGVLHWTHHDPNRRHAAGWIKHQGRTYQ
ncbi:MAG: DUF3465 domain-containing protein [Steroidobacteraceae bacterium]